MGGGRQENNGEAAQRQREEWRVLGPPLLREGQSMSSARAAELEMPGGPPTKECPRAQETALE